MTFNDQVRAAKEAFDNELVPVVPAMPVKDARREWEIWLAKHQHCKFSGDEIRIETGRAKGGTDFGMYSIKRRALKREGVLE